MTRAVAAIGTVMPQLLDAFRTGGGVAWSDYGADMIESQADFNRPGSSARSAPISCRPSRASTSG